MNNIETNTAPTVSNEIIDQSINEDSLFSYQLSVDTFTDVDVGDSLTLSATLADGGNLPTWLSFDASTQTFTGIPDNEHVGDLAIRVKATDNGGLSVSDTFVLTVKNINDAPIINAALQDQISDEDSLFSYQLPVDTFTDSDVGDSLALSATLADGSDLPTWLSFDTVSQTFSGTPDNDQVGEVNINVTATDSEGLTVSGTFTLTIKNTNDAPIINAALQDQISDEDSLFSYQLPVDTFTDSDVGDSLALSATLADGSDLPTWLSFDAVSQTFSGTPDNEHVGEVNINVTATDNEGLTVSDTFTLTINNTNDAPITTGVLQDQTGEEGLLFSYQLPAESFTDEDVGDSLALSATLSGGSELPAWLHFDETTHTLSGTPNNEQAGKLDIKIIATDNDGLTSDTYFSVTIYDVINGDSGNNRLITNGDYHIMNGGEGTDRIRAYGNHNQVNGDEDRDRLLVIGEYNTIDGGDGGDSARAYGHDNIVNGGEGNDRLVVIGEHNTINGDAGNDSLVARGHNNIFNGGSGDDRIRVFGIDSSLNGEAGNDFLYANGIRNTLNGGEGNDTLKVRATASDTIFDGGAGDDHITGGAGNNSYLFTVGDGHDGITHNNATLTATDTLIFGEGVENDDIWFERENNDLIVSLYTTGDDITFKEWYSNDSRQIDEIKLSTGEILLNSQLEQLVQAMAGFDMPEIGTLELTGQVHDELQPLFESSWA